MAAGAANTATAAISSRINDLCRNRMQVEDIQEWMTLEASRRRQAESNVGRAPSPANSIHEDGS